MKTRIIVSAVLLPIFFAVLFIFPPIILTCVISIICAIAAYEFLHAFKIINRSIIIYTIFAAALTPIAVFLSFAVQDTAGIQSSRLILISLLFSIFFVLICFLMIHAVLGIKSKNPEKQLKFRQIPISLAAGVLIPYMLSALVALKSLPYGHILVLLPIIAAFVTDSGAYFVGVFLGKTKPFPTISPNKTVEGYVGGVITGTIGMLIYGIILSYTTYLIIIFPALILYGIVGAIITELGDLTFSFIKRKCGIKDYGRLIPGHGGALDRFDSMIFCAPVIYLLYLALPAII